MINPLCPVTGAPMARDVRPMTLTYKGASVTFDMPGWYSGASPEAIHTGGDMKVSDRVLNRLKPQQQGLPMPEEILQVHQKLGLTRDAAGELIG